MNPVLGVRQLGRADYATTWQRMREFTLTREVGTRSELWLVEHPPVYTLGQAGRPEHLIDPGDIPVVRSDRGGQITYHGPGQLIAYTLIDLREAGLGVRALVSALELSVIDLLAELGVSAHARAQAPGVYVGGAKIAALGLRIKRGCSYHGLALNVDLDLTPFQHIDPCGYPDLKVTRLADLGIPLDVAALATPLLDKLAARLGYTIGPTTTETR